MPSCLANPYHGDTELSRLSYQVQALNILNGLVPDSKCQLSASIHFIKYALAFTVRYVIKLLLGAHVEV